MPFIHDTYGLSGAWCWIRVYRHDDFHLHSEGLIEQYVLWYGPFFLLLIVNAAVTIAIVVVLCHRSFKKKSNVHVQSKFGVRFQERDQDDQQATQYKKALKNTLPLLAYPIQLLELVRSGQPYASRYLSREQFCHMGSSCGYCTKLVILSQSSLYCSPYCREKIIQMQHQDCLL